MTPTDTSIVTLLSPLMVILGFWKIVRREQWMKVMAGIEHSCALMYFYSLINLIGGMILLNDRSFENIFSWFLIVSTAAVLMIQGICGFFAPHRVFIFSLNHHPVIHKLPLIWGVLLFLTTY
ncbi:MAG: hypothetical protein QRY72_04695 [Candidatus Rhabdochlamydia sp.]